MVGRAAFSVASVHKNGAHTFSKFSCDAVYLVRGKGVQGDAHAGETVKHRSRVKVDPTQPNLRQVHLLHREIFDELSAQGFTIEPGALGENLTTSGIDLLDLPLGAVLKIGAEAVVEITGLRNPCKQLDSFQDGLMAALRPLDASGEVVLQAGVMGIVIHGGEVKSGDAIDVSLPAQPYAQLECV